MVQRPTRPERETSRSTMGSSIRSGASSRMSGLRQPTTVRQSTTGRLVRTRALPGAGASTGGMDRSSRATSPAESVMSMSSTATGTKRKDRDYEAGAAPTPSSSLGGTNINVVVRCRGRNAREVKENSTVVVNTDGVKGKLVELSMGASAISDKTYSFDRVFSPAADQSMVYDDTVKPILDDMLAGFNCTIFAYGQTGTGKTYTMSGDMTETLGMLTDEAGIIPRVLQNLFNKLEIDDTENCVKCSFIELYNEELRDLLSVEESAKLKIYDDASRRGHLGTVVQGMEEKHIKNAAEGIKVLQDGSLKRQVAATKCNDLSSRSHTVFTITAYVKKTNEHGVEDLVAAGKLNLVDLAGSENIQRSGAENKRAAEAGLINKSLLTLGRVINALVDRNAHIPYRESKLTRLLQDSLGGRTKTCIIATISPAKTNLEETISTLDYAFRAKNIRNKPQLNAMLNKKTLLREFTAEIEKLKSELITTRQRNGVYLSNDAYEDMTAQSESRRIVLEEQAAKMETLESNLRNKVQEFFSLTTNFMGLKKDHESTKSQLDDTKGVLDQTDLVLAATRDSLARETDLRRAHADTEDRLVQIGGELISTLGRTVDDVSGLHAKNRRKSDLQAVNRSAWAASQGHVADVTAMVERRIAEFQDEQREHIDGVSRRMGAFVADELAKLQTTQALLDDNRGLFGESRDRLLEQRSRSRDDMDAVFEEIKSVRDDVKARIGDSILAFSKMAEKMTADLVTETGEFRGELHTSYSVLGKDFKSMFEDLVKHITTQRSEADNIRRQLAAANKTIQLQNASIPLKIQEALDEERRQLAEDRSKLTTFLEAQREAQEARMAERAAQVQASVTGTGTALEASMAQYGTDMDAWDGREAALLDEVKRSRDQLKTRLKDDWNAANERSTAIDAAANNVHAEAARVAGEQVDGLDARMEALDDLVARAKADNAAHVEQHARAVMAVSNTVETSLASVGGHFKTSCDRVANLGDEMDLDVADLRDGLDPLDAQVVQPLANLREHVAGSSLHEYQPTGETPQKVVYQYPTQLPRTDTSTPVAKRVRRSEDATEPTQEQQTEQETEEVEEQQPVDIPSDSDAVEADSNTVVFADDAAQGSSPARTSTGNNTSLREVNPNLAPAVEASVVPAAPGDGGSLLKTAGNHRVHSGIAKRVTGEGRENVPLAAGFARGELKRKSPRLN